MNSLEWFELANGWTPAQRAEARLRALLAGRSWLLCKGWRRHGPIGVTESPATSACGAGARKARRRAR